MVQKAQQDLVVQAVEARREGAAAQAQAFKRAQGANHLMSPVAARKLRAELAKVSLPSLPADLCNCKFS